MVQDLKASLGNDIISHPAHYIEGRSIEPINVIEGFGLCHPLACVVKYLARAGRKTSLLNDLKKAGWYLDRELQRYNAGINSCLPPLNTKPPFSIQEVLEDWNLIPHLDASLSYILAARLGANGNCSKNYISSLTKAMSHLRLVISECEQGDSK